MKFSDIIKNFNGIWSKAKFVLEDSAPTLKIVGGATLIVGAGIYACVQTYKKLPAAVDISKKEIEAVHEKKAIVDKATEDISKLELPEGTEPTELVECSGQTHARDLCIAYGKASGRFLKIYGLPLATCLVGVTLVGKGTSDLNAKVASAVAATAAFQNAFNSAYERVKQEFGEDKANEIFLGTKKVKVKEEIVDENGKKKLVSKELEVVGDGPINPYVHYLDEFSECTSDNELNKSFILSRQFMSQVTLDSGTIENPTSVKYEDILMAFGAKHSDITDIEVNMGWVTGDTIVLEVKEIPVYDEYGKLLRNRLLINPVGLHDIRDVYLNRRRKKNADKK